MNKMEKGTKLICADKRNKWDMEIDFIKTVNEKSYSLERGRKINKETMANKWGEVYTIPTQEQLDFINDNNKKQLLTKIALDFNSELNNTISILETVNKHSDLLEINDETLDNIDYCIKNLRDELESI